MKRMNKMADFSSTKLKATFEEWHEQLMDYADLRGGSAGCVLDLSLGIKTVCVKRRVK